MGILNIFGKKEKRAEGSSAEQLLTAYFSKEKMTADKALEIPAVSRSINLIAYAAAGLPIKLYRKTESGTEEIRGDGRVTLLNSRTGDTLNASEMRIMWVMDYLIFGNAYGYLERNFKGEITRIFYVSPGDVGIVSNRSDPIHKDYMISIRGRQYYPYEFLKIIRHPDGYGRGRGIIDENALALSVMYSTMKYEERLIKKGGNKKGFLKTSAHVSKETIDNIRNDWNKLYSNEGEGCLFLNDGIDFTEASATSVEMQLNENKESNSKEIMQLFGTGDGKLSEETVKNAVMPVLDAFESAFDADLLSEREKGEYYFAFDTRELTRGDIKGRYAAYSLALDKGFMQIDEVRALEDLPPAGMTFMKLSQADVLYDPVTKRIYTLNSNKWAVFGDGEFTDEGKFNGIDENVREAEVRFRPDQRRDEGGRFAEENSGNSANGGLTKSNSGGIMKMGSDDVNLTAEKETEYGVKYAKDAINADMEYINSEKFAEKFKGITSNENVNQALLECSRKAIEHRNGTLYEDMYLINANTGEVEGFQLNAQHPQGIDYNDSMNNAISKANANNTPLIALHSHPEGFPPSVDDFNSLYNHNYALGVVAGHNGQVYVFHKPDKPIKSADVVQSDIVFAYQGGMDIDRAYKSIYNGYDIDYEIM